MTTSPDRSYITRRDVLRRGSTAALAGAAGAFALRMPAVHAQALPMLDIKFSLNAPRDGSNAAFVHAVEQGYFKEAGLNPSLDPSTGAGDSIQRVASETYQAAFSDMTVMIEFNAKNPAQGPLAILNIYSRSPTCIVAWKSAGITKPADLAGKTLGAPSTDGAFRLFPAFCKATGLDPATVKMTTVDLRLREALMMRKEVDGVFGFDSTVFFNLKSQGVTLDDVTFLYYSDSGLDFYSNSIIVSKRFIREHPERIAGLARACARGWRDALRDPQAVIASLVKVEPLAKPALELERLNWLIAHQIRSRDVDQGGLGTVRPEKLARGIDQVAEAFALPAKPTVADIYTDQYLPPLEDRKV
jgi:NitT/TauT family transport system substrate-binding protein